MIGRGIVHCDVTLDGPTDMNLWFDEELLSEWVGVVVAVGVCALIWSLRGEGNLVVAKLKEEEENTTIKLDLQNFYCTQLLSRPNST